MEGILKGVGTMRDRRIVRSRQYKAAADIETCKDVTIAQPPGGSQRH